MVVERDVPSLNARGVLGGGLVFVSAMVVANDARSKDVVKVLREVLIFVKLTGEANGVYGVKMVQFMVSGSPFVTSMQGVKLVSALLTMPWCRTVVFMVVAYSDHVLSSIHHSLNLRT